MVASSFVCGYIASSFCFFRPAERNVRQFYRGMVLAGLGLNPAGVSLFRMRAPQNRFDEELASA